MMWLGIIWGCIFAVVFINAFVERGKIIDTLRKENLSLRKSIDVWFGLNRDLQKSLKTAWQSSQDFENMAKRALGLLKAETSKRKELKKRIKELEETIKRLNEDKGGHNTTPHPQPPRPEPPKPAPIGGGTPHIDSFHYFFAWIEEDKTYQEVCRKIENYPQNDLCLFCGQTASDDDCLPLPVPVTIHKQCYDEAYASLSKVRSEGEAHQRFSKEPKRISLFYWTLAHWPTYPPDWEVRRKRILERDHYTCQECGSQNNLHIHHKIHIEDGGNHTPDNLICLCKACHEKAHGGRPIPEPEPQPPSDPTPPSPFTEKVRRLTKAIHEKRTVSFHYRDQKGEETDRTFTPQEFVTRHGYLCVKGYCHLRDDLRTFSVHRMSRLTINDE